MEIKNLYTRDEKLAWFGPGEWVDECDITTFDYLGYDCVILRVCQEEPFCREVIFGGHLCGYVFLGKNHVFYEKKMDEIDLDCHGGITFAQRSVLDGEKKPENKTCREKIINHLLDGYLIGFDCAHSFDIVPSINAQQKRDEKFQLMKNKYLKDGNHFLFEKKYRNMEFCVNECKQLIHQLIKIQTDAQAENV